MSLRLHQMGQLAYLALTGGLNRRSFMINGVSVELPATISAETRYAVARRRYGAALAPLVAQHLSEGDNVIELGAGFGLISALVRKRIGAGARHIVLEANPAHYEICARNAKAGSHGTQMVRAAIGYEGETVELPGTVSIEVPATTLGQLCMKLDRRPYALVSDLGGLEGEVVIREPDALSSCEKILMKTAPTALRSRGSSLEEVMARLEFQGFRAISLTKDAFFMTR